MLKIAKDLFDLLYPVGTYYETSNANWTPSSAGWYGTWVEDSSGKTTVAKDTGTFKTLGASVGSESKTTGNHTLTVDEIPSHTHNAVSTSGVNDTSIKLYPFNMITQEYNKIDNNVIRPAGGGKAHNHGNINVIQPSIVVRRWHRTA